MDKSQLKPSVYAYETHRNLQTHQDCLSSAKAIDTLYRSIMALVFMVTVLPFSTNVPLAGSCWVTVGTGR